MVWNLSASYPKVGHPPVAHWVQFPLWKSSALVQGNAAHEHWALMELVKYSWAREWPHTCKSLMPAVTINNTKIHKHGLLRTSSRPIVTLKGACHRLGSFPIVRSGWTKKTVSGYVNWKCPRLARVFFLLQLSEFPRFDRPERENWAAWTRPFRPELVVRTIVRPI